MFKAADCKEVWENCLKIIKDNVSPVSFKTWFEPIVPVKLENNVLTIQVPSPFFYEYLEEQYIDILRKTLRKELGPDAKLEYSVIVENNGYNDGAPFTVKFPTQNKTELKNKPVSVQAVQETPIKNPFIIPGIKKLNVDPQLNPEYNFANFVEGSCNKLARSAGITISQAPGKTAFNPLFIYGGSGLGKTHLAQAIGIEVKRLFPEKIVLYVNAVKFQTQFVDAYFKHNNINDFLHFYQSIDVLILDDVHEFAGKEKTQDAFFHIFNHLHQTGKQLILTSDQAPADLQGLEKRLLSRFKWGLSAELTVPDFETRVAILKKKVYNDGIVVPNDVLEFIASNINQNIRELEGALISMLAQSTLNGKQLTVELASELIEKLVKSTKKDITIDYIQKVVCEYFGLPLEVLSAKTRKREIVQARQIAMYFSKSLTKASLSTIGSMIGNKDHATVLHACKTVNNLMETDKRFRAQVEDIQKKLKYNS
ncbi:MAG: chromosomal replication initiator protein [Tenuifilum sp.]|jgi:chromosomal replication initiator protein|uniref:chromosomal replication initiator protein DnaA n=1 Tax=Tenuifilum sp. TaxID=2760880 RepID=UPI0024AA0BAA|nr:chromosomal replication initiator protein DnaA [Tenuifilum sp.]MDI3527356.1 chromosomal replication initiator protein [Tenuifilum sp.]